MTLATTMAMLTSSAKGKLLRTCDTIALKTVAKSVSMQCNMQRYGAQSKNANAMFKTISYL